MVDFNSEGLFTSNKSQIIELVILGRRDELINTFQLWRENVIGNTSKEVTLKNKLRAVLFALFLELERTLYRRLVNVKDKKVVDSVEFDKLKASCMGVEAEVDNDSLIDAYLIINNCLDGLGMIRVDKERNYKTLEDLNKLKGLD